MALAVGIYVVSQNKKTTDLSRQNELATKEITLDSDSNIPADMDSVMDEAQTEAEAAQDKLKSQAEALNTEIEEHIAKAKDLLNNGDYEGAMKIAQNILSNLDGNSSEAQSIIAQAKKKIQELAQAKLNSVKEDLKGKLPTFGK